MFVPLRILYNIYKGFVYFFAGLQPLMCNFLDPMRRIRPVYGLEGISRDE